MDFSPLQEWRIPQEVDMSSHSCYNVRDEALVVIYTEFQHTTISIPSDFTIMIVNRQCSLTTAELTSPVIAVWWNEIASRDLFLRNQSHRGKMGKMRGGIPE